jgi:hypothetical protein
MLKTLDVVIGFAFVMLVASSAVTVLTQTIVNALQLRGWTLRDGLARLLRQADGALSEAGARDLAEAVLRHPLLSGVNGRRAAVVGREELVPVLLHLARPIGAGEADSAGRRAARELVARTPLGSPGDTLRDIRHLELRIEGADPGMARHVRSAQAVITAAASDLTAVLFSWFDQTMDRVRDRFVSHTRWITVGGALAVTLALPLDSIGLVDRLSSDAELRRALVTQAAQKAGGTETAPTVTDEERGALFAALGPTLLARVVRQLERGARLRAPPVLDLPQPGSAVLVRDAQEPDASAAPAREARRGGAPGALVGRAGAEPEAGGERRERRPRPRGRG